MASSAHLPTTEPIPKDQHKKQCRFFEFTCPKTTDPRNPRASGEQESRWDLVCFLENLESIRNQMIGASASSSKGEISCVHIMHIVLVANFALAEFK